MSDIPAAAAAGGRTAGVVHAIEVGGMVEIPAAAAAGGRAAGEVHAIDARWEIVEGATTLVVFVDIGALRINR